MQRPDLRASRGLVELRLPARRPLQQGDRRPLRRAQEGRPAGQVGVRDALLPDLGHRGLPHGPRQRVRQRRDRPDARGLRHREVAIGQGLPLRQRRRRVDQQDTEGRARPPRDVRHDARAPGQALGLRAPVRQLQDPLDAGLHVSGRVQGGGAVPPGIVQIGVANPGPGRAGRAGEAVHGREGGGRRGGCPQGQGRLG